MILKRNRLLNFVACDAVNPEREIILDFETMKTLASAYS